MALTHRLAALVAVVAIPLGIAVTSYLLTDSPDSPTAPARVELESGTPAPGTTPSGGPGAEPTRPASPSDETVPRPAATDGRGDDDTDDRPGGGDDGDDAGDDGPGDDG